MIGLALIELGHLLSKVGYVELRIVSGVCKG